MSVCNKGQNVMNEMKKFLPLGSSSEDLVIL